MKIEEEVVAIQAYIRMTLWRLTIFEIVILGLSENLCIQKHIVLVQTSYDINRFELNIKIENDQFQLIFNKQKKKIKLIQF